jgi:hypothetical protein
MNLTTRQAKFVDEYVISGNAAAAARAAGYSENGAKVTACRMLTKPNLKVAIAAKRLAGAEGFEIRREHVIAAIMQAIAMAKEYRKPATMLSGWVAIGKMLGFYDPPTLRAEKLRKSPDGSENIRHVSSQELLSRISEGGIFRNEDGSAMNPGQIDAFYKGLSTEELMALSEGKARVVTKIEFLDTALATP